MGVTLWLLALAMGPIFAAAGLRYIALAILIFGGMAVYGVAGHKLGAFRLSEFARALRKG
jgi:putative peptidoglycan lipid II flippase